jgi:hypothetical protein
MRLLKTCITAAILAVFFCAGAALATPCQTVDKARTELTAQIPGVVLTEMNGVDYVRTYNALPPRSDIPVAEIAVVVEVPGSPVVVVIGFRGGCSIGQLVLKRAMHEQILAEMKNLKPEI